MNFEIQRLLKKVIKEKKNNKGQVLVAVAAGLGLGAILAVLFAPESGKDLRAKLCAGCEEEVEKVAQEKHRKASRAPKPKSSIKEIRSGDHADETQA